MKPFLVAWATYLLLIELMPVLFLARIRVPEKADFGGFYAAGILARTEPSHLYELARQRSIQIRLVDPENGWVMFAQPPYEALLFVPFSLLPYRVAYLLFLAFNVALIIPCFLLARAPFSHVIDPWQPKPRLALLLLPAARPSTSARTRFGSPSACLLRRVVSTKTRQELPCGSPPRSGALQDAGHCPVGVAVNCMARPPAPYGFLAGTTVLAGASFWLVGVRGMQTFLGLLVMNSLIKGEAASAIEATGQIPSLMPNLRGLLYGCGGNTYLTRVSLVSH